MNYTWFYIFNYEDFIDTGLVSKTYSLILDGIGLKDVLVTKGVEVGLTYEGIFLPLNMNDKNPFEFEDHAIYIDENENVWLGIAVNED